MIISTIRPSNYLSSIVKITLESVPGINQYQSISVKVLLKETIGAFNGARTHDRPNIHLLISVFVCFFHMFFRHD